jgi:hypothetical protein
MVYSVIFIILFIGIILTIIYCIKKGNIPAQKANDDLDSGNDGIIGNLFD